MAFGEGRMSLGLTGDEDLDGVRGPAKAPVRDGGPPRMDSSVIRFAIGEKATCRAWIANFGGPAASYQAPVANGGLWSGRLVYDI